ncbi:hypothetical protein BGZ76_010453 [Entomortierella beljakovae]|nr:hypothetical protein BGZ76_010453 [Entomortierella beljakovae]
MSDEPRRKRKWDNQGDDNTTIKRAASEIDPPSNENTVNSITDSSTASQGSTAVAAAAAIAQARLNAKLVAQGIPPFETDGANSSASKLTDGPSDIGTRESKERHEFVHDIDINDLKNRYTLTKGSVQTQLQRDTGADVTTRGRYYSDRSLATEKDPPLYLHVTAVTQESLDMAVEKINELMEEAQNSAPPPPPPPRESFQSNPRMQGGPPRHQSFHARVSIGLESERMFNVRAKIVGPGGQYVKHVQNETKTRVQLKGQGSGYFEVETGRESEEPLYINIIGNTQEDVDEAERLCKDLVETVKAEYEKMKSRPPMPQEPYGQNRHYGSRPNYHNGNHHQRYQGGHHQYQQPHHQYNYNQHYQAHPQHSPTGPPAPLNPPLPSGTPPASADKSAPTTPTTPSTPTAPAGDATATPDQATQGYTYEQYEAYNQYYYQQQYYQQYGQYYQQAYGQTSAEQGQGVPAAAPVSSDPALAYYGYGYAPPPLPTDTPSVTPSTDASNVPPPPPPVTSNVDSGDSLTGSNSHNSVPPPPE